jgi:phosphoglycolate phosphatase-like HAD superfamily hydrolase
MTRLLMWDVDQTLLRIGSVVAQAYAAAFVEITGQPYERPPGALAGRTDLHIAAEAFAHNGIADHTGYLDRFFARYAERFRQLAHLVPAAGRLLPGVPQVLATLAARDDIVQTVVTGNIRPVAEAKLAAFGLSDLIDFEIGGYGTDDGVRATLVTRSRERAEATYGAFTEILVIGDTVHDVAAALANGVTAIGVATGPASTAELSAAGAHAVLDSLADVDAALDLLAGDRLTAS